MRLLGDSSEVVGAFAGDPNPGLMTWDDFTDGDNFFSDVTGLDVGSVEYPALPVWAVHVPNRG